MFVKFHNCITKYWLMTLLSAGFLLLCGCDNQSTTSEEGKKVLRPVKYQVVEKSMSGRTRTYSGTSKAGREANLSFKVGGTLQEIPVKVGDSIGNKTLIARLNRTSFELEVEKSRATLAQAEAENRNAGSKYQRVRELYENDNSSREDLDSARTSVESAKAQVRSAKKSLELALLDLGYTELRASEKCSVAEVFKEVNENVTAGEAIVAAVCGQVNEVEVKVPENLIASIKQGMPAKVRFDAIAGVGFTARVTEVGVTSAGGATFPVTLIVKEKHSQLRSGLAAEVTFIFPIKTQGPPRIYLPPVAVGQDRTGRFVFVLEPGDDPGEAIVHRRPVTVGELTSMGLEITSGVKPGNKVVTAGMSVIRDGLHVKAE